MANSNRQRILEYLAATTLSSTTINTGAGYNFTVAKAERGIKSKNQLTGADMPALFVASADEKIDNNKTGKGMIVFMTVFIYGLVEQSDSTLTVQAELDKLIEDVKKALLSDPGLGGRANATYPKAVVCDEGDQHPYAWFRMEIEIQFTGTSTAP